MNVQRCFLSEDHSLTDEVPAREGNEFSMVEIMEESDATQILLSLAEGGNDPEGGRPDNNNVASPARNTFASIAEPCNRRFIATSSTTNDPMECGLVPTEGVHQPSQLGVSAACSSTIAVTSSRPASLESPLGITASPEAMVSNGEASARSEETSREPNSSDWGLEALQTPLPEQQTMEQPPIATTTNTHLIIRPLSTHPETATSNGSRYHLALLALADGSRLRVVSSDGEAPTEDGNHSMASPCGSQGCHNKTPFPVVVYAMLEELSVTNPEIMCWTPQGDAFLIDHKHAGLESVLRKHFQHSKYTSFQRQLNTYGWNKVRSGQHVGTFFNPLFHRDRPQDLCMILRNGKSGVLSKSKSPWNLAGDSPRYESPIAVASTRLRTPTTRLATEIKQAGRKTKGAIAPPLPKENKTKGRRQLTSKPVATKSQSKPSSVPKTSKPPPKSKKSAPKHLSSASNKRRPVKDPPAPRRTSGLGATTAPINTSKSANWGKKSLLSLKKAPQYNTRAKGRMLLDLSNNSPSHGASGLYLTEPNMGRALPDQTKVDNRKSSSLPPKSPSILLAQTTSSPWKPIHGHPWGQGLQQAYQQSNGYQGLNTPKRASNTVPLTTMGNQALMGNDVLSTAAQSFHGLMGQFQSNEMTSWTGGGVYDASPSTRLIREPLLQYSPQILRDAKENYFLPIDSESPPTSETFRVRPSCIPAVPGFHLGQENARPLVAGGENSSSEAQRTPAPLQSETTYAEPIPLKVTVGRGQTVQISPMGSWGGTPRFPPAVASKSESTASSMLSPSPVENLAYRQRQKYQQMKVHTTSHPSAVYNNDVESFSTLSTRPPAGLKPSTSASTRTNSATVPSFSSPSAMHPFAGVRMSKELSHVLDFNECLEDFNLAQV